jgi:hypothetical protein
MTGVIRARRWYVGSSIRLTSIQLVAAPLATGTRELTRGRSDQKLATVAVPL